ncbi:Citrinin biosynthesis transcriptional activator ctnR like protein [Verticillium longisporum]|nr:Citrinin biosynthesis transcriptional activator ctnR like protein [Verticillium longisporum]
MDTSNLPPTSSSCSAAHYFPNRRRVWQACTNCRARKTRCDAAKPKCSLCMAQNVDCVYKDSNEPRIDHNTRIMLERIQMLEDRLFSSPVFSQPATTSPHPPRPPVQPDPAEQLGGATSSSHLGDHHGDAMSTDVPETDQQIPIPLSHTANANHVLEWPIVQQLLSQTHLAPPPKPASGDMQSTEATDIFFTQDAHAAPSLCPPESWRLFNKQDFASSSAMEYYRELIQTYFDEVNIFFPLLSLDYVQRLFDAIVSFESSNDDQDDIAPALHCLVLLVLSFGSLCTMLASLYTGAMGRVSDSFHWAHATAVKCEALAKRVTADTTETGVFSESFRRLYWVAFIYEGDFISEVSITLPSGIARYEDVVPYPVQEAPSAPTPPSAASSTASTASSTTARTSSA